MTWPLRPFAELAEIRSGGTPRRSRTDCYGGEIPWAKIRDLDAPDGIVRQTEETLSQAGVDAIGGRTFHPGTVLLAMYGSVGKVAIAGVELTTNQAILGIVPRDQELLDDSFLKYWLTYMHPELERKAQGVTQRNLSAAIVRNLRVPLPTLSEQRYIVQILRQADSLCGLRHHADTKADRILPALFHSLFGDPTRHDGGWNAVSFTDVFEDITSQCPKLQRKAYKLQGRFPVVDQGKELVGGFADDDELCCKEPGPVIVFGDHTRVVKYVDFPFIAGADGSRVLRVRPGFVTAFAATHLQLQRLPNLGYSRHMRALRRLPFIAPKPELQEKFSRRYESLRRSEELRRASARGLDRVRGALLARAFAGSLTNQWRQHIVRDLEQRRAAPIET